MFYVAARGGIPVLFSRLAIREITRVDALVLAILGGAELRLELEAEERLLAVLVARARARDVVAPEDAGDLLKARAEAIRAGLVPTQHARPKRTQDELLQALRHKNRTTAAA